MGWITARLFQASTLKGIIQLGGSLGLWNISDSMQTAIIATVMGVIGLINVAVDEHRAGKATATRVATSVAAEVANDAAKSVVERNLPWLVKQEVQQQKER